MKHTLIAVIAALVTSVTGAALAEDVDGEIEALMALDSITIEGISYLVLCEQAMRPDLTPIWQLHRERIIRAIGETVAGEERALLRFDEVDRNARNSLAEWENDETRASPRIRDANLCLSYLRDNEHETSVAIARVNQERATRSHE